MPVVPFRIVFAFRPARYRALDRGQGSVGSIWEAPLPHASPLGGQGLAEPPHPRPSPQGGEGRVSSELQPSPLAGEGGAGKQCFPSRRVRGVVNTVAELTKASTKPNEPKRLKTLVINELPHGAEKQTQARYEPRYQSLTTISAPILKKFVWIASALLRIRGCGPALAAAQTWEGLPPKPRCPLE